MVEFLENSVCLKTVQTFLCHVGYRTYLLRPDCAVGSLGPALVVCDLKIAVEFLSLSPRGGHCPPLEQVLSSDRLHSELNVNVYLLGFSRQLKMSVPFSNLG